MGFGDDVYGSLTPTNPDNWNNGDDYIWAGGGRDFVLDVNGQDTLNGNGGNDTLIAANSADTDIGADVLRGGAGNDDLWGDNGDFMKGGQGADDFKVTYLEPVTGAAVYKPVQIADFDVVSEQLTIDTDIAGSDGSDLTFALATDGTSTEVRLSGSVVAVLAKVAPADLGAGSVVVVVQAA
jgi:Ca2+-binding RTX toxin-like protein